MLVIHILVISGLLQFFISWLSEGCSWILMAFLCVGLYNWSQNFVQKVKEFFLSFDMLWAIVIIIIKRAL